ncbi:MAG: response regulator transcription factor [Clostridia bacterium]|nr:response regulator transcription factor [Clostridia bacterium]
MLSIAICDDEKHICDYIESRTRRLLALNDIEATISTFSDGEELVCACKENPSSFDIIFLDIKMKKANGVECAKTLRNDGVNSLIVFVTSSAEYVFSGYEAKAFRYILKTDLENAFDRIFTECFAELKKQETDFFTLKTGSVVKNIPLNDIFYFESKLRVITLHTKNEEISFYGKLDNIEKELAEKDFIRIHQSFFVNALKIKALNKETAELSCGTILPISKSKTTTVKQAYLWSKR